MIQGVFRIQDGMPRCRMQYTSKRFRSYTEQVIEECGAGGAAYTSDAVERHLCSLRVPCERERRTARPQPPPAAPHGAPPPAPPPAPGPFIYNTSRTAHPPCRPPEWPSAHAL
ncbi:jg3098 [Pararge aegeria aegeria]|uniref:Jg3098 protein n=1 Tax=Pararge aegeria aegeria TaxID=348720 RepID=A0A8S4QFX7_9NEOP|nr:jg3098 [Pararge aegeria aegeria]